MAYLRKLGVRNTIYMDDIWGGDQKTEESSYQAALTVALLKLLGLVVKVSKSVLDPVQRLDDYLGFILDSGDREASSHIESSFSAPLTTGSYKWLRYPRC